MPGRGGYYTADLIALQHWRPDLVISMVPRSEVVLPGAASLPNDLAGLGIGWAQCAVADYDIPVEGWHAVSALAHAKIQSGGRVLIHCMAGCGRSWMAALRLMVEAGEDPAAALIRLREARPHAVEADAQFKWAASGKP